ncbi:MAG: UvrB/UvrC motif-containing protein [Candidatus Vogelbacteria bacterium]|nr:UvrB/UvrC motif-containing protein [Candidatus Vogelbacteria bacterium]
MKSQELKHYKLPDNPGVYHFKRGKKILYIGKATSLKDRVKSYFNGDILDTRGPKIEQMLKLADRIDWQETHSVLEALLLETELIKKYQPPYNTREKDDKSYWHVIITDEDFPRILPIRGRELFKRRSDADQTQNNAEKTFIVRDWISDKSGKVGIKYQFGPFPYGAEIKEALKIVRRIFPFRDKCQPCKAGKSRCDLDFPEGSPRGECQACFNRQIGLCPGVCTGEISKTDYQKIIRNIKLFFEGKKMVVIKNLEREMKSLARKQEFEKAGKIRNQIFALQHIQDVSLLKNKGVVRSRIWLPLRKASRGTVREKRFLTTGSLEVGLQKSEVVRSRISQDEKRLLTTSPCSIRIEAYDIAHISGSGTVGARTRLWTGTARK